MAASAETLATSHPQPAASYEAALAHLRAIAAQEDQLTLNPVCKTTLLSHGGKRRDVVIFFHGYTNCPAQFAVLGQRFFDEGYNVLIPRIAHHGLADRLTAEQAKLAAAEMVRLTEEAIDIGHGLGERVTVAGLSAGGVMAAWAAQFRSDLDLAMVCAPALGLPFVPPPVSEFGKFLITRFPNRFIWWDPRYKDQIPGPDYAYPRFATKGLSEVMHLGAIVRQAAQTTPPRARAIVLIHNEADPAVNLPLARRLGDAWQRHAPAKVQSYTFPKGMRLIHDMVDPVQKGQQIEEVYPVWLALAKQVNHPT